MKDDLQINKTYRTKSILTLEYGAKTKASQIEIIRSEGDILEVTENVYKLEIEETKTRKRIGSFIVSFMFLVIIPVVVIVLIIYSLKYKKLKGRKK